MIHAGINKYNIYTIYIYRIYILYSRTESLKGVILWRKTNRFLGESFLNLNPCSLSIKLYIVCMNPVSEWICSILHTSGESWGGKHGQRALNTWSESKRTSKIHSVNTPEECSHSVSTRPREQLRKYRSAQKERKRRGETGARARVDPARDTFLLCSYF